jgi:hypothetical protein
VLRDHAPETLFRSGDIYSDLSGIGYPKDVIPWRRSDFDVRAAPRGSTSADTCLSASR